jgi:hypothetical protein
LAKQFAEILHFVLKFDDLKMNNPAIQNDFSYYRRTLSKMKMNNVRVASRLSQVPTSPLPPPPLPPPRIHFHQTAEAAPPPSLFNNSLLFHPIFRRATTTRS